MTDIINVNSEKTDKFQISLSIPVEVLQNQNNTMPKNILEDFTSNTNVMEDIVEYLTNSDDVKTHIGDAIDEKLDYLNVNEKIDFEDLANELAQYTDNTSEFNDAIDERISDHLRDYVPRGGCHLAVDTYNLIINTIRKDILTNMSESDCDDQMYNDSNSFKSAVFSLRLLARKEAQKVIQEELSNASTVRNLLAWAKDDIRAKQDGTLSILQIERVLESSDLSVEDYSKLRNAFIDIVSKP
jgi:hypothetical protein